MRWPSSQSPLFLSGLAVWLWASHPAQAARATVAVLPFENLTGDPDRAYLASGLTEETAVAMSQLDPTHVRLIGQRFLVNMLLDSAASPITVVVNWTAGLKK
jgi:hypothetical protein